MSISPADVTFRVADPDPAAAECTDLTCSTAAELLDPAVVVGTVLASVLALVAFAYLRDARGRCREECRRVADEQDAFEEFAAQLRDLPAGRPTGMGPSASPRGLPAGAASAVPATGRDPTLDRVKRAYRETVMSVPHYEEEYDDDFHASVAAELGDDAAAALIASDGLTPDLREGLTTRTREAVRRRENLTDALDAERDRLDDAETRLARIDRERRALAEHLDGRVANSFDACADVWRRLDELEQRCAAVASDRQAEIRDPPLDRPETSPSFYRYLYGRDPNTDHPVLAEVAALVSRIRADRERVEKRIANAQ
ncbi:DUF7260 family protein [Haloparvum sedimenti]|uniref:DUF7260 family protein n=1 Tax=Haloparvum sedimenti TaxID=1678448 RepID=UPI00071E9277|nr:hypothetical protein [Haloparvum sedimenti]